MHGKGRPQLRRAAGALVFAGASKRLPALLAALGEEEVERALAALGALLAGALHLGDELVGDGDVGAGALERVTPIVLLLPQGPPLPFFLGLGRRVAFSALEARDVCRARVADVGSCGRWPIFLVLRGSGKQSAISLLMNKLFSISPLS